MYYRTIISETNKSYINVEAIVAGEDEKHVLEQTKEKFAQLVKQHDHEISKELAGSCAEDGFYYSENNETGEEFGLYVFEPEKVIEV